MTKSRPLRVARVRTDHPSETKRDQQREPLSADPSSQSSRSCHPRSVLAGLPTDASDASRSPRPSSSGSKQEARIVAEQAGCWGRAGGVRIRSVSVVPVSWTASVPWVAKCTMRLGQLAARAQCLHLALGGAGAKPDPGWIGAQVAGDRAQFVGGLRQRRLSAQVCEVGDAAARGNGNRSARPDRPLRPSL